MNLSTIIIQLRAHCPAFEGRVAGSARFQLLEESQMLPVPAAFVVPLDDRPDDPMANNAVRQPLIDSFGVIVALSNTLDERGQAAAQNILGADGVRAALWKALLGWRPAERYNGIIYHGGSLLGMDRARLWYQFEFGAYMELCPEDGYEASELAALPDYDELHVNWDVIDPIADPNLDYPGPDGRIEFETSITP